MRYVFIPMQTNDTMYDIPCKRRREKRSGEKRREENGREREGRGEESEECMNR